MQKIILSGNVVSLEPLQEEDRAELKKITADQQIWTYTPSQPIGGNFDLWFNKVLENHNSEVQVAFVVRLKSNRKIVGSTRFYDIHSEHKRLAIGYTWYVPAVWGSAVNPECKLLLLSYAFEKLDFNRVEFFIDSRNARSCTAVKKLGAQQEGILRQHMILADGYVRDTAVFSIIKSDWPQTKLSLLTRLEILLTRSCLKNMTDLG